MEDIAERAGKACAKFVVNLILPLRFVSRRVNASLSHGFAELARPIASYPGWSVGITMALCAIATAGFLSANTLRFYSDDVYVKGHSNARRLQSRAQEFFGETPREERLLFSTSEPNCGIVTNATDTGDNVTFTTPTNNILTRDCFDAIWDLHSQILAVETASGFTLADLCDKAYDSSCELVGVLDFWGSDEAEFESDVWDDLSLRSSLSATTLTSGEKVSRETYFGNYVVSANSSILQSAEGVLLTYVLGTGGNRAANTTTHLGNVLEWENLFLQVVANATHNNTSLDVVRLAERSLDDQVMETLDYDLKLLAACFIALAGLTGLALPLSHKRFSIFGTRFLLGFFSVLCVVGAVCGAFGLCATARVPFTDLMKVVPFIFIIMGVHDIFLIVAAFDATSKSFTGEERLEKALQSCGPSITLTALMSTTVLVLGALVSSVPVVKYSCIYGAISVVALFLVQFGAIAPLVLLDHHLSNILSRRLRLMGGQPEDHRPPPLTRQQYMSHTSPSSPSSPHVNSGLLSPFSGTRSLSPDRMSRRLPEPRRSLRRSSTAGYDGDNLQHVYDQVVVIGDMSLPMGRQSRRLSAHDNRHSSRRAAKTMDLASLDRLRSQLTQQLSETDPATVAHYVVRDPFDAVEHDDDRIAIHAAAAVVAGGDELSGDEQPCLSVAFCSDYTAILGNMYVMLVVMLFFAALFAVACIWIERVAVSFDAAELTMPKSYARNYIDKGRSLGIGLPEVTVPVSLYVLGADAADGAVQASVLSLQADLLDLQYIAGPVDSWLDSFLSWTYEHDTYSSHLRMLDGYAVFDSDSGDEEYDTEVFYTALNEFLSEDANTRFYKDVTFAHEDFGEIGTANFVNSTTNSTVTAWRTHMYHVKVESASQRVYAMKSARDVTDAFEFPGSQQERSSSAMVFLYCEPYLTFEHDGAVYDSLINFALLGVIGATAVALLLLGKEVYVFGMLLIVVAVGVEGIASLSFWGLEVGNANVIILMMCTGLLIQYCGFGTLSYFLRAPSEMNAASKVRWAVSETSPALVLAAATSMVALGPLAYSDSRVFRSLILIIWSALVVSTLAAITVLPVVLVFIGGFMGNCGDGDDGKRVGSRPGDRRSKRNPKVIEGEEVELRAMEEERFMPAQLRLNA